MDRDLIQRQDFPTGRRGYDIAAVDDHLRRVADAFESNTPPPAPPSLAATTSDQVREILEAAERSVTEVRTRAGAEAADHVARVQTATDGMLAKLDHLESELTRLLTALRTSGEALSEGLSALQADVAQGITPPAPAPTPTRSDSSLAREADSPPAHAPDSLPAAAADSPPAVAADDSSPLAATDSPLPPADSSSPAADAPTADSSSAPTEDSPPSRRRGRRARRGDSPPTPATESSPDADSPAEPAGDSPPTLFHTDDADSSISSDEASARLIALNMALNGNTREEAASYLAEHFELEDPDALLDDVFARAGR